MRDLTSHSNFNASLADLIEKMADEFIKRHDPMEKKLRAIKTEASSATDVKPSIATLRNRVFQLDGQRCSFKDHRSGKTCGSTFQLEIDHIMPKALGGTDNLDNLRVYCRVHNQFAAQQTFGKQNGHPKAAVSKRSI
ncbi:MAG: HNH endonuclease [Proteobacteria bacterium]|nr:MAG: HNH endonuclease [Pseudomonadota bacterium]